MVLNAPPTFGMYAFNAAVANARVLDVPRLPDFSLDVPGLLAAARSLPAPPRLLFLTSPNNPDGSVLCDADLRTLLAALPSTLVVLDEAYVEFTDSGVSRMPWVLQHANLAVLRTFSKRAGLAGLRVGYGAFPKELLAYLWRAKQPYNVSVAAERAAVAALGSRAYLERVRALLVTERSRLAAVLAAFPQLSPYPSQANFLLVRCAGGAGQASELQRRLAEEHGIMVRYYTGPPSLAGCIRVSVGKPDHTDALQAALKSILGG